MENREITGIAYQQETLFGDDVREYLLEKWKSAYCRARDVRREIDPILPKSLGGTVRVSRLVICSQSCHQKKGKLSLYLFLKDPGKLETRLILPKETSRLERTATGRGSRQQCLANRFGFLRRTRKQKRGCWVRKKTRPLSGTRRRASHRKL